jgi:hypothetical protein
MSIMQMARLGAMDLPTVLALLGGATVCYAAWLRRQWRPTAADCRGFVLPDRDRAWCRHLVRRLLTHLQRRCCGKALRPTRQP